MPDKFEPANQGESEKIEAAPTVEKIEFQEEAEKQLASWQVFYDKYFGVQIDAGKINIPERTAEEKEKFTRLIVVGGEITLKKAYDTCKGNFPCVLKLNSGAVGDWIKTEEDWNERVTHNDRDPKKIGTYAVWVEDCQETNEVNTKLSNYGVNRNRNSIMKKVRIARGKRKGEIVDVPEDDIGKDITLLERFLYELKYFDETGDHLDKAKRKVDEQTHIVVGEGSHTVCSGTGVESPHCSPIVEWTGPEYGMYVHYMCFLGRAESSRPVIADKNPEK